MIDPKFNELSDESPRLTTEEDSETEVASAGASASQPRRGLSINDTIAGDTLLSSGSRGVDTSGVRAGAGAGAGGTSLIPGGSSSPAPSIAASGRGTTTGQGNIGRADTGLPGAGRTEVDMAGSDVTELGGTTTSTSGYTSEFGSSEEDYNNPTHDEIAARAFVCWNERGCPVGSPETDWETAYHQLRQERRGNVRTLTASV